jgi:hypothetical protein
MDSAFGNFPAASRVKRPVKVEPISSINSNEQSIAATGTGKSLKNLFFELFKWS